MHQKHEERVIDKLIKEIKDGKGLGNIELKELLRPGGYADKVVGEAKLTRVQLRKIFAEFKTIKELYKKENQNSEKILTRLYKLYPMIQYQTNRKLISEDFKKLIFAILDSLDQNFTKKNFDQTMEFMEALVAYTRKD